MNNGIRPLDILAFFSFIIGLENFSENKKQTSHNDASMVDEVINDIYKKFEEQNNKLDKIITILDIGNNEEVL